MKYKVTERIEREFSIDAPKFLKRDDNAYQTYRAIIPHDETEVSCIYISTAGITSSLLLHKKTTKEIDSEYMTALSGNGYVEITEQEFRESVSKIVNDLTDKLLEKI